MADYKTYEILRIWGGGGSEGPPFFSPEGCWRHPTTSLAQFKAAAGLVIPGQAVSFTLIRNRKKLVVPVQTSEVDKEAFAPGRRHINKVPGPWGTSSPGAPG